jgi:predicted permease
MKWLLSAALRGVPRRWRAAVAADLREEAARRGPPGLRRDLWVAAHALAIGWRLRREASRGRFSLDGLGSGVGSDLRASVRRLLRTPAASLSALVTIAAGVAGVGVVYAVLLHTVIAPLPFSGADRLVAVYQIDPSAPATWRAVSAGNFLDFRRAAQHVTRLVAARNSSHSFTGFEDGDTPLTRQITHDWFDVLGIAPALGRSFRPDEDVPGGPRVAILSHGTWLRRYGGKTDVLGLSVELDRVSHTIVGVMPEGYDNPVFGLIDVPAVWVPLQLPASGADRAPGNLFVAGRLGRTPLGEVHGLVSRESDRLAVEHPDVNRQVRAVAVPMAEGLVQPVRTPLVMTFLAVLAVFLAACANASSVMLARAIARRQEFALQQAIGARRLRIGLQVLGEHLLLAAAAGVLAVPCAALAGRGALALVPPVLLAPRFAFEMDAAAFATIALAAACAGFVTALPALAVALRDPSARGLQGGAARIAGGGGRRRLATLLVAAEMAVAVVLVVGAGLVTLGFDRLRSSPPGFDAAPALTFRVSTRGPAYEDRAARRQFFDRLLEEFRALPGVRAAGAMAALPVFPQFTQRGAFRADEPPPPPGREPRVAVFPVSDGLIEALGTRRLAGRLISDRDLAGAPRVVVLGRSAARLLFGDAEPLGRSLAMRNGTMVETWEVVGLVEDVRSAVDPVAMTPAVYQPMRQAPPLAAMGFVLKVDGAPMSLVEPARAAVRRVDRQMPLYQPRPMSDVLAQIDARARFVATLIGAFAVLGLLLVATGIYGTLSHLVAERQREMGVRLALGATRSGILTLVLRDGLRSAGLGLAAGLAAALACGRLVASGVDGTPAFHGPLFLAVPAALFLLAVAASVLPALRAARVEPIRALRAD